MYLFLFGLAICGFPICLIWLVVAVLAKKAKRPAGIGLLTCVILFIVSMLLPTQGSDLTVSDDGGSVPTSEIQTSPTTKPDVASNTTSAPMADSHPESLSNDSTESDLLREQDPVSLDAVMETIRVIMKQNFGEDNFTLEYDQTGVTISVWGDNIAPGARLAATGDETNKEAWDKVVNSQVDLCNSIVDAIGIDDYAVMVNLLNEVNKDNILLIIMNGNVLYDCVNG